MDLRPQKYCLSSYITVWSLSSDGYLRKTIGASKYILSSYFGWGEGKLIRFKFVKERKNVCKGHHSQQAVLLQKQKKKQKKNTTFIPVIK